MRLFILNILLALDRFGNTLFGGDSRETISSRSARARNNGKLWGKALCGILGGLDPGHCDRVLAEREPHDKETIDLENRSEHKPPVATS